MSSILDIVSATLIGGILLLVAMTVSDNGMQEFFSQNSDAIMQAQVNQVGEILNYDLHKMGFGIAETDTIIIVNTANRLKFISQLNMNPQYNMPVTGVSTFDNIADTITYTLTPADSFPIADLMLYQYDLTRSVKAGGVEESYVIGKLAEDDIFKYFDASGAEALLAENVRNIEIYISALNPRVILSEELVATDLGDSISAEIRDRELKQLTRPSFVKVLRFSSRNLRR